MRFSRDISWILDTEDFIIEIFCWIEEIITGNCSAAISGASDIGVNVEAKDIF